MAGGRAVRIVAFGGVALAALGGVSGAAAWQDLRQARAGLQAARRTLEHVVDDPAALRTPVGRADARRKVDDALVDIRAARSTVHRSWGVAVVGAIPGVERQRDGVLSLVDDAQRAAEAGRRLLSQVDALAEGVSLDRGVVPLDGLDRLQRAVASAAGSFRRVDRPSRGLWGGLADARRTFDRTARATSARLNEAAGALRAATGFLGASGPRRYFVAMQNNAEMRDQGMVLSYAVITCDRGRVTFEPGGSVHDLALHAPAPIELPGGMRDVFGFIAPNRLWQSVNGSADFPWSARAMTVMFRQATGRPVDGVVALDVPALASLLKVTGPVGVPGVGQPVSADNVSRILLHDFYAMAPKGDQSGRREQLADVADAVVRRLLTERFDTVALGRELGDAAAGGHLRLWSGDRGEEATFERAGLGGTPAAKAADRTFHLAVENGTASKLDYYVRPSVKQHVTLTEFGTAVVRTTVTVENRAPRDGKASYQLGPDRRNSQEPGEYWAWMLFWGPARSIQAGSVDESGLRLSSGLVAPVLPGQRGTREFETVIPNAVRDGRLDLRYVPQARLAPVPLEVTLDAPGWRVSGDDRWAGEWSRVVHVGWTVSRRRGPAE